jgi:retinol dehydrogenase 12
MGVLWDLIRVTIFGSRNNASRSSVPFDLARDIPSLAGKVIIITGAAGDLGRQTAVELARHGRLAKIYIVDVPRDESAKKELVDRVTQEAAQESGTPKSKPSHAGEPAESTAPTEIRFLDLDLGSFASIQKCAAEFTSHEERLDILLLNAGIMRPKPGTTKEGHEAHFGINYLGHTLLTRLLIRTMLRTAQQQPGSDVRVEIVASEGHAMAPKGGFQFEKLRTDCAKMVGKPPNSRIPHFSPLNPWHNVHMLIPEACDSPTHSAMGRASLP